MPNVVIRQPYSLSELTQKANEVRQDIIQMLATAGSGHTAGPLGMADIFTALYFAVMNYDPQQPHWPDRDRLVVSNGHICPVWYVSLAEAGFFPMAELATLRKINSRLQGHPNRLDLPGVENSSGPLGQGISQAIGMALAGRLDQKNFHVFCITSDGEHDEGQTWEAILFAAKEKLQNLTVIVDDNNIQIDGFTNDILPLGSLAEKYRNFGWRVREMDGHNMAVIVEELQQVKTLEGNQNVLKPSVIIAHTTPGKGVSFMENKPEWHGKAPSQEEASAALQELRKAA
jgi:transketolase